jgi:hypothetical protein
LKATTKLESDIKKLQDTHGLTMKIIILWENDANGCYNQSNIDECVSESYVIDVDMLLVLQLPSWKGKVWRMQSQMRESISGIIPLERVREFEWWWAMFFEKLQFKKWLISYIWFIWDDIKNYCTQINLWETCSISEISLAFEKDLEKKQIFLIILLAHVLAFIILAYIWMRMYYISKLKELYNEWYSRKERVDERLLYNDGKAHFKHQYWLLITNIGGYLQDVDIDILKVRHAFSVKSWNLLDIDNLLDKEELMYKENHNLL